MDINGHKYLTDISIIYIHGFVHEHGKMTL